MDSNSPKLRNVSKFPPPFPLNKFPKDFPYILAKEIVYLTATKETISLQGSEWEEIFAKCIGAEWKPSNVGLDDVVLGNTAWGAKSVKSTNPFNAKQVRLISGRNSPVYSFGDKIDTNLDPNDLGGKVLEIFNERVSSIRQVFKNLRTVVLIKSEDLSELVVFEFETIRYDASLYSWQWNKNGNLVGNEVKNLKHKFTWQPHGSQFTIIEEVPEDALLIKIKKPKKIKKEEVLKVIGFDESWVQFRFKA